MSEPRRSSGEWSSSELASVARAELELRERSYPDQVARGVTTADAAGRGLAAWRAIVGLFQHNRTEFEACLGETAAEAWPQLVEAAAAAVDHRARADHPATAALRRIRDRLTRSAIRAGVDAAELLPMPVPSAVEGPTEERVAA